VNTVHQQWIQSIKLSSIQSTVSQWWKLTVPNSQQGSQHAHTLIYQLQIDLGQRIAIALRKHFCLWKTKRHRSSKHIRSSTKMMAWHLCGPPYCSFVSCSLIVLVQWLRTLHVSAHKQTYTNNPMFHLHSGSLHYGSLHQGSLHRGSLNEGHQGSLFR